MTTYDDIFDGLDRNSPAHAFMRSCLANEDVARLRNAAHILSDGRGCNPERDRDIAARYNKLANVIDEVLASL